MSFDEVYIKYYSELRRFGKHLNLTQEKCEDIVQETFIRFWLELKKNVIFNNPRAWLYKVFLNLFKTQFEIENRRINSNESMNKSSDLVVDPHIDYIRNEKKQILIKMLDQLEGREKEILLLYHNGFSYSEMAEILEINPNSVGKTLVRAIESLKRTLKTHYHELFEQN
jgi:RNA polymerase sigma-70 factor (ECF subfamily)